MGENMEYLIIIVVLLIILLAVLKANKKFMARFRKMEELAVKPLEQYSFEEYDALWQQAKTAVL